jgi:hypothetical protein
MAVGKKFPEFPLAGTVTGQEFLVGYNADATSEMRTSVQTIIDAVELAVGTGGGGGGGGTSLQTNTKTITYINPNADTVLDTIDLSKYSSVKYVIDIRNDSTFCVAETLVTSFSGIGYITVYGILGDEDLLDLTATTTQGNIYLKNGQTSLSGLSANITGTYSTYEVIDTGPVEVHSDSFLMEYSMKGDFNVSTSGTGTDDSVITVAHADYKSIKITARISSGSGFTAKEVLVVTDGLDTSVVEYGTVFTGTELLMDWTAEISGGNLIIKCEGEPSATLRGTFDAIK